MMMEPSDSEEERIAKLHRTLHSLATRIPRIVLQQVEEVFPALKESVGVNIGMSTTEGVKKVECKECSNMMTVSGDSVDVCEQCRKLTLPERPYTCEACAKTFMRQEGLTRHKRIQHRQFVYTCHLCKAVFQNKTEFISHRRGCTKEDETSYSCDLCKREFTCVNSLRGHECKQKMLSCGECDKTFHRAGDLQKHSLVHSAGSYFTCEMCDKSFAEKAALTSHKCKRSREPQYLCRLCNRAFVSIESVKTHQCAYFTS